MKKLEQTSPCDSSLPYRRCLRSLPSKLLELKYFSQNGLLEETVYIDFQPGGCPKDILLNLIEKKILIRRPTSLPRTRQWPTMGSHVPAQMYSHRECDEHDGRHTADAWAPLGSGDQGHAPLGESHSLPGKGFSRKWAQAMMVSTVIVSLPWQRKPASESWTDLSPSEFWAFHLPLEK